MIGSSALFWGITEVFPLQERLEHSYTIRMPLLLRLIQDDLSVCNVEVGSRAIMGGYSEVFSVTGTT